MSFLSKMSFWDFMDVNVKNYFLYCMVQKVNFSIKFLWVWSHIGSELQPAMCEEARTWKHMYDVVFQIIGKLLLSRALKWFLTTLCLGYCSELCSLLLYVNVLRPLIRISEFGHCHWAFAQWSSQHPIAARTNLNPTIYPTIPNIRPLYLCGKLPIKC